MLTVLEAMMDGRGQSSASSGFCSGAARDLCVALRSGDPCRHTVSSFCLSCGLHSFSQRVWRVLQR